MNAKRRPKILAKKVEAVTPPDFCWVAQPSLWSPLEGQVVVVPDSRVMFECSDLLLAQGFTIQYFGEPRRALPRYVTRNGEKYLTITTLENLLGTNNPPGWGEVPPVEYLLNLDRLFHERMGVHLKATLSGTSRHAWRVTLPKDTKFWNNTSGATLADAERHAQLAYFGGWCYIRGSQLSFPMAYYLDVNQMFGSVMRDHCPPNVQTAYPTDTPTPGGHVTVVVNNAPEWLCRREPANSLERDPEEAFLFDTPETLQAKVTYLPGGTFTAHLPGVWKVEGEVVGGFAYRGNHETPFKVFADRCFDNRKHPVIGFMFKRLLNGLYGSFGSYNSGEETLVTPDPLENLGTWEESPQPGHDNVYTRPTQRPDYYCPAWAASITAEARQRLIDLVKLAGGLGEIYYLDTDGLMLSPTGYERLKHLIEPGVAGKLKLVAFGELRVISQKRYVILDQFTGGFEGADAGNPNASDPSNLVRMWDNWEGRVDSTPRQANWSDWRPATTQRQQNVLEHLQGAPNPEGKAIWNSYLGHLVMPEDEPEIIYPF